MTLSKMNPAQMILLESFASVNTQEELNGLVNVLKIYYAQLLDKEMERLWDNGTLDQTALDNMRHEHFRTPYRKL